MWDCMFLASACSQAHAGHAQAVCESDVMHVGYTSPSGLCFMHWDMVCVYALGYGLCFIHWDMV